MGGSTLRLDESLAPKVIPINSSRYSNVRPPQTAANDFYSRVVQVVQFLLAV